MTKEQEGDEGIIFVYDWNLTLVLRRYTVTSKMMIHSF
jgi:hypothetical protein